jgi:hypothetical protein
VLLRDDMVRFMRQEHLGFVNPAVFTRARGTCPNLLANRPRNAGEAHAGRGICLRASALSSETKASS